MRNIDQLAISRAVSAKVAKEARQQLGPGNHNIDSIVRIFGTLFIGEDEEYTPTAEIPLKATLALFIRHCGITRETAIEKLVSAMQEALRRNETGHDKTMTVLEKLDEVSVIDDCMSRVLELAAELPKKTRAGKVRANLTVEEVL